MATFLCVISLHAQISQENRSVCYFSHGQDIFTVCSPTKYPTFEQLTFLHFQESLKHQGPMNNELTFFKVASPLANPATPSDHQKINKNSGRHTVLTNGCTSHTHWCATCKRGGARIEARTMESGSSTADRACVTLVTLAAVVPLIHRTRDVVFAAGDKIIDRNASSTFEAQLLHTCFKHVCKQLLHNQSDRTIVQARNTEASADSLFYDARAA